MLLEFRSTTLYVIILVKLSFKIMVKDMLIKYLKHLKNFKDLWNLRNFTNHKMFSFKRIWSHASKTNNSFDTLSSFLIGLALRYARAWEILCIIVFFLYYCWNLESVIYIEVKWKEVQKSEYNSILHNLYNNNNT